MRSNIKQAHKPDEFVKKSTSKKYELFLKRIIKSLIKMNLKSIDYELPKELIAKNPTSPRDNSSTLVEVKESFEIYKFTYLINLAKR